MTHHEFHLHQDKASFEANHSHQKKKSRNNPVQNPASNNEPAKVAQLNGLFPVSMTDKTFFDKGQEHNEIYQFDVICLLSIVNGNSLFTFASTLSIIHPFSRGSNQG